METESYMFSEYISIQSQTKGGLVANIQKNIILPNKKGDSFEPPEGFLITD
jgi:hypothetical protein